MRVLYFYQYFTVPQGSYSTRAYEFARRWVKAGDSVTVVTSVYDKSGLSPDKAISRFNIEGVDVRMINIRLSQKHGKVFRLLSFAAYAVIASWYALTKPADVVLCSSGPLTVGLPGLIAHYIRRRPFVFEVRDLWPEGAIQLGILTNRLAIRLARSFERLCYRSADKVVALSEGMADWIRQTYTFNNLEVVPNASDNEMVDELTGDPEFPQWAIGKRLAIYAGTLGLIDDCAQILDVAALMQECKDIEFVVIGDGKERPELERRRAELDLNNVHFLGPRPKKEVMQWLKASCCALFTVKDVPFLATASPNKVFDAFAAGLPVVQTTNGWISSLLEREDCGLTVRAGDTLAMRNAIVQLARNDETRSRLAANARRIARTMFDRTMLAEKMRRICREAANRKGSREVQRSGISAPAPQRTGNR